MNVQDNHTKKSNWEEDRESWGEQENNPCLDYHLGILEMDFELWTTVEIHVSIKGLFSCRILQLLLRTAPPLIIGSQ